MEAWLRGSWLSPWTATIAAGLLLTASSVCESSGFRVPGLTVTGIGLSEAVVANPEEVGAIPYNPAAMSFHDQANVSVGMIIIEPTSSAKPDGGRGKIDSDPNSPFVIPNIYGMTPITDRAYLGLNITAPFGLETNWPSGTFPAFNGQLAALGPTKTSLEMLNFNPNLSYLLTDSLSIAFGLDYYYVRDATSNSQGALLKGDGDALTWNLGVLYTMGSWSLGLSYLAPVDVEIDGSFDARSSLGFKINTKTELGFPGTVQLGARYKLNEKWGFEFDIDRTSWSNFDEIVVKSRQSLPVAGITKGTEIAKTTNNWDNTLSFHFGSTYQMADTVQFRAGYTFNQNPQPESYYSPRYPNAQRHLFNVGVKYAKKRWQIEGALSYVQWERRDIENSGPFLGGDPNGTSAFNGRYENSGIIGGLSASLFF